MSYPTLYVPTDGPDVPERILIRCGLCSHAKSGETRRALYEMAFHYDRRHQGWTTPAQDRLGEVASGKGGRENGGDASVVDAPRTVPAPTPASIDLDAIRARCEAASPGPWRATNGLLASIVAEVGCGWFVETDIGGSSRLAAYDAAFIAHARTDVPALLAEVERLAFRCSGDAGPPAIDALCTERDALRAELDEARREAEDWRERLSDLERRTGGSLP